LPYSTFYEIYLTFGYYIKYNAVKRYIEIEKAHNNFFKLKSSASGDKLSYVASDPIPLKTIGFFVALREIDISINNRMLQV
jgi:hypothetical protein